MKKIFCFLIFLLPLTLSLQAQLYRNELYLEHQNYFREYAFSENATLGYRFALNDKLDFHYTVGFNLGKPNASFSNHIPITWRVMPFISLLDGDYWGLGTTLIVFTALIPEGVSYKIPLGHDQTFYVSPYIFPFTGDFIKNSKGVTKISWSQSIGVMLNKEYDHFSIRSKIGLKQNVKTNSFAPEISVGIGWQFIER
jgi:hypothetical protein